jgi:hypothetical protein
MRSRAVAGAALIVGLMAAAGCSGDDTASQETMLPLVTTTAPPTTLPPVTTTLPPTTTSPPTSTTVAPTTTVPAPTTAAGETTTTANAAAAALLLRDDGLGDALFGADPDGVVDYVSSILGVPTDDTGWDDPFAHFGVCPGTEVRGVTWGDLQLLFSDDSVVVSGRRHFFNYVYGPPSAATIVPEGLHTADGIGIGSTVADLRRQYPGVQVYPEEIYGPYFVVNENFSGFLTGVTDSDTVISFIGGIGCGE